MRNKILFILVLLAVFSFVLRTYKLDTNPAGFFCDEANSGIDALSILKTGRDSHGEFLPIFFRGLNNAAAGPFFTYLNIPFILIFGLTEKAVRLPVAIIGTIEIIIFFLLLKEFIPKSFALLGTLLLSISPWHLHTTRNNIGDIYLWTFLTLIAYLSLTKAFKENKTRFSIFSAFFFGLAMYTYIPSRLITPLLFGLTIFLVLIRKHLKQAALMMIIYSIICIPFIHYNLTDPYSSQRIKDTVGIDLKNINLKNLTTIDGKKEEVKKRFFTKYILHYSDIFLFHKGDADYPGQSIKRHSISGMGLLYPYQKLFIITGLLWLFWKLIKSRRLELLTVIFLLFLFPVSDSLTEGTPYATRSYLGILPFYILTAFGIYAICLFLSKCKLWKIIIIKIPVIIFFSFLVIFSVYILLVRLEQNPLTTSNWDGWQYGPREIMKYFLADTNSYDDLYMSPDFNGPEIFLKFYDPENRCVNKCKIGNFSSYNPSKHQLFSLTPDYLEQSQFKNRFVTKKTLYYPNGKIAFLIGEVISSEQ